MVLNTLGAMAQTAAAKAKGGGLAAQAPPAGAETPQPHEPTTHGDGAEHDPAALEALLGDLGRLDGATGAAARRVVATMAEARAAIEHASADLDDVREVLRKVGMAGS